MQTDTDSANETARHTTLNDLAGLALIDAFRTDAPSLAGLLGLSRAATYKAIERGDFPCLRSGRRVRVPVPALLKMLGAE